MNRSNLTPSSTIPRIKSLIKPPPSRTSWELLLNDYLKDPDLKSKFSPSVSPSYKQSSRLSPLQSTFSSPIEQPFVRNYSPQSLFSHPYPTNSTLSPRRYQIDLDELVYLISQVGRSDLYREIVQYIQAQPPLTGLSTSQASNINACSSDQSTESFFLDFSTKHRTNEN